MVTLLLSTRCETIEAHGGKDLQGARVTQSCVECMVGGVLRTGVDQGPVLSPQQAAQGAGAVQAARQ